MDELTPFDQGLVVSSGNDGVMPIDEYIESILDECTIEFIRFCPNHKLPTECEDDLITPTGTTIITFPKPDDFIKIISIKFGVWAKPIYQAIGVSDPIYKLQSNTYAMGKKNKPIVVECSETIECYSISSGDALTGTFKYAKIITPETITKTESITSISWLVAAKVLGVMGSQAAKFAIENYTSSMQ